MFARVTTALKAARQLGLTQVALYALYKLGIKSGHFKRVEHWPPETGHTLAPLFDLPEREAVLSVLSDEHIRSLRAEADEIIAGRVRLFGAAPVNLRLTFDQPLHHWTDYEAGKVSLTALFTEHASPVTDIKFLWEAARFGWAFTLGRDYYLTGSEESVAAFWRYTEQFLDGNPPGMGPHWMNGQEVALRLMALAWAGQVFAPSAHSTPARMERLAAAVAAHARRIPPTLLYARAQNNNHLLTEAAALYTAGLALPKHPLSKTWRALGWKWLVWCFKNQIDAYGEYVQHSANYHRLMLHTALWVHALARRQNQRLPARARENLYAAAHWLYALLDPISGRAPNLGANDGANILPLAALPFEDYRPVTQAAARAFMGYSLPSGVWDELALWLGLPAHADYFETPRYIGDHLYAPNAWGYLRAAHLKSRPSHADQLHFDLWWRGLNVARDAGTYLYNASAPWDNRLTATQVHNTITVDGREQMTRAGRFLYLDWTRANPQRGRTPEDPSADHEAANYHRAYAAIHKRTVQRMGATWRVTDQLGDPKRARHTYRLHWLLPDWGWELEGGQKSADSSEHGMTLRLMSPLGWISLTFNLQPASLQPRLTLVRAGEYLYGSGAPDPVRGWVSPTYGVREPALSLAIEVESNADVTFVTNFILPD